MEDALYAEELKADGIGFIFAKSPRQITPARAKAICSRINHVNRIGVFVNESMKTIRQIKEECGLDIIQFHGDENPQFCAAFGNQFVKVLRVKSIKDLNQIDQFKDAWKIVLDAFVPGQRGGTGKAIQKDVLEKIQNPDKIILAGGLKPDNISSILSKVNPFGVDVSSGVEKSPGIKDHKKMNEFINQIRGKNA